MTQNEERPCNRSAKLSTATRVLADVKLTEPIERIFASGTSVCVCSSNWGTAMMLMSFGLSVSFTPASKTVGKPTKVVAGSGIAELTTTSDSILFFEDAGLVRVTKTTPATRTVLLPKAKARSSSATRRTPTGCSGVAQYVAGTKVVAFVVDANTIYWAEDGKIFKTPK